MKRSNLLFITLAEELNRHRHELERPDLRYVKLLVRVEHEELKTLSTTLEYLKVLPYPSTAAKTD